MPSPGLDRREPTGDPRGLVLMLHGGAKTGLNEVGGRSASFRRTSAMRNAHRQAAARSGSLAVAAALRCPRLERRRRPRALTRPRRTLGPRPGRGRAPRRTRRPARPLDGRPHRCPRRRPPQRGRVSSRLAPWLEPQDPVDTLDGRHLIAGHGSRDKITSAQDDEGVRRPRQPDRRLGEVRRHGPPRPLHAAQARRVEPLRRCAAPSRSSTWPFPPRPTRNAWTATTVDAGNDFSLPPRAAPATMAGARVPVLVGLLFGLTGLGSSSAAIVLPVHGLRPRREHRHRRVGDQPLRADARGRDGRLRPGLRPRRASACRCSSGSA